MDSANTQSGDQLLKLSLQASHVAGTRKRLQLAPRCGHDTGPVRLCTGGRFLVRLVRHPERHTAGREADRKDGACAP